MKLSRLVAVVVSLVILTPTLSIAAPAERDITTLGGDRFRNHYYRSGQPGSLCVQNTLPVGWSLSQPLIVRFPRGTVPHEAVVFHLGQTHLYVLTPDGDLLASHWVQSAYSWGSMTYAKREGEANPSKDILYITYGDDRNPRQPGVKAYRVADLLNPSSSIPPGGSELGATPLGAVGLAGLGVASAPLFMGYDEHGLDRLVISIVPDTVVIIKNLAMNTGLTGDIEVTLRRLEGWNSGTATRLSDAVFAVAAGNEVSHDGTIQKGGLYFYYVEGRDTAGVQRYDFEPAHKPIQFDNHGLTQVVRDPDEPLTIVVSEQNGTVHRLDMVNYGVESLQIQWGFSNTGPSMSTDRIYSALRWENNTTSTQTPQTSDFGRLIAIDKTTFRAWSRPLTAPAGAPPWHRSWVNVTPLIWESTTDPSRQVILIGDAGGNISTWHATSEPEPLFLTDGLAPVRCDEIESTDPGYRPTFTPSARTLLTPTPHTTHGADAWHNTQGVATEMSVYAGRLFAGYNNAHPHEASSSLVIFRSATNLVMGALTVQDGHGAITGETVLQPGQQLRVSVPLYLEGDPLAGPKRFQLAVGWEGGAPVVRTVTLEPFQQHVEYITLTVPANAAGLRLMAVANPALYAARRDQEVARGLLPPGVADAPAAVPAAWVTEWEAPVPGEVWVLDNARTWSQPYQCDLSLRIHSPAPGAQVDSQLFTTTVTVSRIGCGGLEAAVVEVDGARQLADFTKGQAEVTLQFEVFPEACGPFTVTATVDPGGRIPELNETNNRAERTVAVSGCAPIQTECPPSVSPAKCRGSRPTSYHEEAFGLA